MKTATVRDLRNRYTSVLRWVIAGEEIVITQRGKAIARLIPEPKPTARIIDWSKSPAVTRNRTGATTLKAAESLELIHEAGGKW